MFYYPIEIFMDGTTLRSESEQIVFLLFCPQVLRRLLHYVIASIKYPNSKHTLPQFSITETNICPCNVKEAVT